MTPPDKGAEDVSHRKTSKILNYTLYRSQRFWRMIYGYLRSMEK